MILVLVTGADGQLGKSLRGIASDFPQLNLMFKNSRELDITDTFQVQEIFGEAPFDYCINCAAYTNVEKAESEKSKAFAINAEGVRILADSCANTDTVLFQISTDYVFDGEKAAPYTVEDIPNPINVYGASKLKGEENVRDLLDRFFIVRTSWLYSEHPGNFYTTILRKAKKEKVLRVTDEQTGCPTRAIHLAKYILNMIQERSPHYGIYHFTDGEPMTWYDFAKNILDKNKLADKVELVRAKNYRTFARRPKNSVLM